jgi:hypothetical protein
VTRLKRLREKGRLPENIPSNAFGQILLEFNPSRNYAYVNSLEIKYRIRNTGKTVDC